MGYKNKMISKLLILVTLTVSTFAQRRSDPSDKGFFAGLKQGVFLPDEASIEANGCSVPEEPQSFEQMKAMLPMVKMMLTNMNNGVEPPFMGQVEKAMHQLAMIFAVATGKDFESEFCRGLVFAEEGRTLFMMFSGDFMSGFFGGAGQQQQNPKVQKLMGL